MLEKNPKRTEYHLYDGTLVPGVTTVLQVLDKPALHKYFYECGEKKTGYPPPNDGTAGVGRIAHYLIAHWLRKDEEPVVISQLYEEEHRAIAEKILKQFQEWYVDEFDFPVEVILVERPLVNQSDRYGGTPDLLIADKHGNLKLIDIKTSSWIYEEYYFQLAAYRELIFHNMELADLQLLFQAEMDVDLICVNITKKGQLNVVTLSEDEIFRATAVWKAALELYKKITRYRNTNTK